MRTVQALMGNNRKHPSEDRPELESSKGSRDEGCSRDPQVKEDWRYGDKDQHRNREGSRTESYNRGYQIPRKERALTPPPSRNQQTEGQYLHRTPPRRVLELEQPSLDAHPVVPAPEHPRRGYETTKHSRDRKLTGIVIQKINLKSIRRQLGKLMEIFNVIGTLLVLPTKESIGLPISK